MSALNDELAAQLDAVKGLPPYEREAELIPGRKFAYDFYFRDGEVVVEAQGGTWGRRRGGHNTGSGMARDMEKLHLAQQQGIYVLQVDAKHVRSGEALVRIFDALVSRKAIIPLEA